VAYGKITPMHSNTEHHALTIGRVDSAQPGILQCSASACLRPVRCTCRVVDVTGIGMGMAVGTYHHLLLLLLLLCGAVCCV
jgi:hypothetical protein